MATRLPYYTGEDDIYSQLMRQFQTELPYYSAPVAGVTGGYNPMLYSMPPGLGYNAGLLGDTGFFAGAADSASDGGLIGSSPTSGGFGGFGGFGSSGVSSNGSVSTGFGGLSLSPSGVVSPNSLSVPASIGLGLAGLVTGLPLGLIGMIGNQSAAQAAQALSQSLSDSMGANALGGMAATAGPGGTGGAAAAAASAAAAAASAAGLSDAAIGAASQAAANAAISGASPSEAAAIGASAAAAATTGESGIAGLATGFSDGGTAGGDASGIAGLSEGFSDSGSIGGNSDAGPSGGDGAGPGGAKIICTKLHELGKMSTEIYEADQAFGAMLVNESPETYQGYVCWAQHVVRWMGRDDLFGKFVVFAAYHIATPWSKAMAQEMGVKVESGWFGRFLMKQGLKVCRAIGKMNQDRSVKNV